MPAARGLFAVARDKIRTRHLAYRTEQAYLQWMRRFVRFHGYRHPREMGAPDVEAFLTHLAVTARASASTQNQAMQAILFLYRQVLEIELPWLENVTRAHRPKRLPAVLSIAEVRSVLAQLEGMPWLVSSLLYGGGLRLMEALRLRVKDLDLERGEMMVRGGKGAKDRVTVFPAAVIPPMRLHLDKLRLRYRRQRRSGDPGVSLPAALSAKFHGAATQWGWQFVFPAESLCRDPYTHAPTRHHLHVESGTARSDGRGSQSGHRATGELSYIPALLRDALARFRMRHSNRAGTPGSRRCAKHHDLHPCAGQGRDGRQKPFGWRALRIWSWVTSVAEVASASARHQRRGGRTLPSLVDRFSAARYSVI
jgi:integron integrase